MTFGFLSKEAAASRKCAELCFQRGNPRVIECVPGEENAMRCRKQGFLSFARGQRIPECERSVLRATLHTSRAGHGLSTVSEKPQRNPSAPKPVPFPLPPPEVPTVSIHTSKMSFLRRVAEAPSGALLKAPPKGAGKSGDIKRPGGASLLAFSASLSYFTFSWTWPVYIPVDVNPENRKRTTFTFQEPCQQMVFDFLQS